MKSETQKYLNTVLGRVRVRAKVLDENILDMLQKHEETNGLQLSKASHEY